MKLVRGFYVGIGIGDEGAGVSTSPFGGVFGSAGWGGAYVRSEYLGGRLAIRGVLFQHVGEALFKFYSNQFLFSTQLSY